jgi:hypothetical protein
MKGRNKGQNLGDQLGVERQQYRGKGHRDPRDCSKKGGADRGGPAFCRKMLDSGRRQVWFCHNYLGVATVNADPVPSDRGFYDKNLLLGDRELGLRNK